MLWFYLRDWAIDFRFSDLRFTIWRFSDLWFSDSRFDDLPIQRFGDFRFSELRFSDLWFSDSAICEFRFDDSAIFDLAICDSAIERFSDFRFSDLRISIFETGIWDFKSSIANQILFRDVFTLLTRILINWLFSSMAFSSRVWFLQSPALFIIVRVTQVSLSSLSTIWSLWTKSFEDSAAMASP